MTHYIIFCYIITRYIITCYIITRCIISRYNSSPELFQNMVTSLFFEESTCDQTPLRVKDGQGDRLFLSLSCSPDQNMGSYTQPSLFFLLPLLTTFLLLLLPHFSYPGKTGLLVAGGEGAMRSAEVATSQSFQLQ